MIASPLRPRHRQESGIAAAGRLAHQGTPYGASLSFATTTHLWPLPDPPSRKPRSATSRTGDRPVNSGPRPCLFSVGFPLSGPRDRTSTSDLNIRTRHTRYGVALRAPPPRRPPQTSIPTRVEQLSNVVDEKVKHQAATFSSVVVVSSSVTLMPSLNFTPASTSPTSSWPLNRRQRSWAASSSL